MAGNTVVLKAKDIDGYLTAGDNEIIGRLEKQYAGTQAEFGAAARVRDRLIEQKLIDMYNDTGETMKRVCKENKQIHIYSFEMPHETHGEASRLIAKLRDVKTVGQQEYMYYTQRAYEMLFNFVWGSKQPNNKRYFRVETPVDKPNKNYAIHKIPDIDAQIENTMMCVMLRGALLPSMIVSKEIQEWHSRGYITPFALFKVRRNDAETEETMEYILDLNRSYFDKEVLNGKDLIFCDPMNATGGSMITTTRFLKSSGVTPRSIKFLNIIAAMPGALRIIRAIPDIEVYSLWMDPVLNDSAYILPGLGDFGDRLNMKEEREEEPRNLIQLIANYGANVTKLYQGQLREIERTIFDLRGR